MENITGTSIVLLGVALFTLIIIVKGFRVVNQSEVMVVERLGKFYKLLHPGVHIIIPLVDVPRKFLSRTGFRKTIDLREQVLDIPSQSVISKDNVNLSVDAVVFYQITDPKDASYEIADMTTSITTLTQTSLRSLIGELELDETLSSRDTINTKLQVVLDEASNKWGVKVTRVELSQVDPPSDIKQAMEKELRAERDRRAVVLEAEGNKKAQILEAEGERDAKIAKAEGDKQAEIARAEGEAKAKLELAQAEAEAVNKVNTAIQKGSEATDYFLSQKYLDSILEIGKSGKQTFVLPMELIKFAEQFSNFKKK